MMDAGLMHKFPRRTHCKNGRQHEGNIRIRSDGYYDCRICTENSRKAYRKLHRERDLLLQGRRNATKREKKAYKISMDWLLCGDLQGRLRMARDEIAQGSRPVLTPDKFRSAYASLDEKGKALLSGLLLAKKGDAS
jgi:hypothetical protein